VVWSDHGDSSSTTIRSLLGDDVGERMRDAMKDLGLEGVMDAHLEAAVSKGGFRLARSESFLAIRIIEGSMEAGITVDDQAFEDLPLIDDGGTIPVATAGAGTDA